MWDFRGFKGGKLQQLQKKVTKNLKGFLECNHKTILKIVQVKGESKWKRAK